MRTTLTVLSSLGPKVKTGLALFGLCVLVIVAAEFTARVVLLIDDSFFDPTYARSSILPSVPDGYDAAQLLLDMDAETRDPIAYQPYTLWTHRPFAGTLLRIDERGNRVTLNNSQRDDALQLWMFGGSTMRSGSVPDGETIPSHLSRILNQEWGLDAQVSNYGESGFVSTQEVIALIRELQTGRRPDVVIFYDGANDAFAASRFPEVVGAHHGLDNIRDKLEDKERYVWGEGPSEDETKAFVRSFSLFRVARFVGDRIGFRSEPEFFPITPTTNEQLEVMATQAFGTLLENHKITAALGAEYGFTSFLMLQPTLWSEGKPLHPSEEAILNDSLGEPGVNDTMAVRSIMANMLEERSAGDDEFRYVYNFSDVFDAVSEPLYKDWAHVSFKGNQVVAESMFEILKQEVCERPPGNISDLTNGQLQLACG